MFKVGVGRVELRSSLTGSTRPGPYQMEELTIGSHTANGAPSSWQIQSSEGGTARNGASSLGISGHLQSNLFRVLGRFVNRFGVVLCRTSSTT